MRAQSEKEIRGSKTYFLRADKCLVHTPKHKHTNNKFEDSRHDQTHLYNGTEGVHADIFQVVILARYEACRAGSG